MAFADALTAELAQLRVGGRCSVAAIAEKMGEADREAFVAALAKPDDEVPSKQIAKALASEGFTVGDQTVRRHRRGDCKCPSQTR